MKLSDLPTNQVAGAIIIALVAAVLKFFYDRHLAERKDRLDRLTRQLELLYGPLLALSYASNEAWKGFCSLYCKNRRAFFDPKMPPTQIELDAWKLWIKEVFMPLNERIEEIILNHLDLLEESTMPRCFLELISHVEGYKGVIKEWDVGKSDHYVSFNNFPNDIEQNALKNYTELKKRQMWLLQGKGLTTTLLSTQDTATKA